VTFGDVLFGNGELVHKREAQLLLFCAKVHLAKFVRVLVGGFPTDLAAEPGFVAGGADAREVLKKKEEACFDEVPIFCATGKEGAQPEVVGTGFIDVDDAEVALA